MDLLKETKAFREIIKKERNYNSEGLDNPVLLMSLLNELNELVSQLKDKE
ncbi:hypothetical protein [Sutcliffiella horikoshii]